MLEAKYGLPPDVRFCTSCVTSNQRPNSCVEYLNLPSSKKPTIHFDEEGICDACRVAEAKEKTDWTKRERELAELCNRFRSPGGEYDVIVPGSGGKDSYFAAHVLKHRYGMHPLLVTWAPNLYTPWGWRNMERWQKIGSHLLVNPNRDVHRLLTRLALENLFHPFHPFTVGQKALAPRIASEMNIPFVVYGENEAEYGNPKEDAITAKREQAYFTLDPARISLSGVSLLELFVQHDLKPSDLAPYMPATPLAIGRAGVEVHYLGYYLKWKPQEMYYYACEHGGFEAAPERTPGTYSKYNSIDDKLDDLHYWTTYIKFGIGRATYDAAQEIRSGDITREEGVALVKRFDGEYPERFEREVFEYLSVPGFPEMNRERLFMLADKFKSPHLWDGNQLRSTVWNP